MSISSHDKSKKNSDYSKWWAYVKYKNFTDEKEFVQVSKIYVEDEGGQRHSFKPKDFNDFDINKFYCVKTSYKSADKKSHYYYANIGRLAGSEADVKSSTSRPRWPAVHQSDKEPTSSEEEIVRRSSAPNLVISARDVHKKLAATKRTVQDDRYKDFTNRHSSEFNFLALGASEASELTHSSIDLPEFNNISLDEASSNKMVKLDQRLAALETKDKGTPVNTDILMKFFEEKFKSLESKMDSRFERNAEQKMEILQKLRGEISQMKEFFSKSPDQDNVLNWLNSIPM